jgi:L-amino acid N-acyltransferase YncA
MYSRGIPRQSSPPLCPPRVFLCAVGICYIFAMGCLIRFATPDDAPQVQAIYAPYCRASPVSFEIVPPSVKEIRARIARVLKRYPWLVCECDGMLAGYVYASTHRERPAYRWSADVAVYVHESQHRRGVGRGLYTALFGLLRQQGYINAIAGITLPNPASVGMHKTMGFKPIGIYKHIGFKTGAWHDVVWCQLLLQSLPQRPREPRNWRRLKPSLIQRAMREGAKLIER